MTNTFKFLLLAIALLLSFTSCDRDDDIDSGIDTINPINPIETIEVNPIIQRTSSNGDLDFGCFEISFPLALLTEDGTEVTINQESEFVSLLNDSLTVIIDFVYPLGVSQDGENFTVADNESLSELFASCVPIGGWDEDVFPAYLISDNNSCFDLVYPVSLEGIDGTIIDVADEAAFNAAIASDVYFFVFPLSIIDENDLSISIEDTDGLFEALISCNGYAEGDTIDWDWDWQGGFEYLGCYMIEFPFDVSLVDGTIVTVNNHEELCDLMLQGHIQDYVYPLALTGENGTFTVNNEEELFELLEDCADGIVIDNFDLLILSVGALGTDINGPCYVVSFPIEVVSDAITSEIANLEQLETEIELSNFQELPELVYPVTITLIDGSVLTLNNQLELYDTAAECE